MRQWENLVVAIMLRVIFFEKVLYLLAYFHLPVLRNLPHQDLQNVRLNTSEHSVEYIDQEYLVVNIKLTKIF
jgi:hypothetical protein